MNTIEHLRELFIYNDWANRRIITALKTSPSARAKKLMAHILTTEQEYYQRLHGKDSTGFDFWPDLELDEMGRLAQENGENYEKILLKFDDEGLGTPVNYKTSAGERVRNSFRDILTHVLLHSMNHRGQANIAIRDNGFTPPPTDYIIYAREIK